MPNERDIGGIRCSAVLEHLSGYLDGELERALVQRIEEHLQGCNLCESFGNEFIATLKGLSTHLTRPNDIDSDMAARLRQRFVREPA